MAPEPMISESEERLAGLIAVLGIERLTPVLDRMDPKEAFLIRQLARRPVKWEVVDAAREELSQRLAARKAVERFESRGEFWA